MAGAVADAAAMAAFAAGGPHALLLAAGFLLGAASTAMVDAVELALADLAGEAERAAGPGAAHLRTWLARQDAAGIAGDLLGPALLAGSLAAGLGWRPAFLAAAAALAAYAALLAASPLDGDDRPRPASRPAFRRWLHGTSPRRHRRDGSGAAREAVAAVAGCLRDRRVWGLGAVSALLVPLDEPLDALAVGLLEARGVPLAAAAAVTAAGVVGGIVALVALAPRLEGRGDGRLLAAAAAGAAGGLAVLVVAPAPLAAVALAGVACALDVAWLVVQHRTLTLRPEARGATKAVVGAIELAGHLLPLLVGAGLDRWAPPTL